MRLIDADVLITEVMETDWQLSVFTDGIYVDAKAFLEIINNLPTIESDMKDDEFVRIKMEMPKRCWDCRFYDDNYDYPTCIVNGYSKGYNFNGREKRMDDCPLI